MSFNGGCHRGGAQIPPLEVSIPAGPPEGRNVGKSQIIPRGVGEATQNKQTKQNEVCI